ncbi:MAG: FKBP-type peptidyl-prolyl cis-trans isomerase [Massilia sp.]
MNFRLPLIAAFVAILGLSACGGGGGTDAASPGGSAAVTTLSQVDTAAGTGNAVVAGNYLAVRYTLWLYNSSAANFKGTQVETNTTAVSPFYFVIGTNAVIAGWEQGLLGMKAGGKRTLVVPASMAYGATAKTGIPANSALVFDVELVGLYPIATPTSLVTKDTAAGTGATVVAGNTVTATYTLYLYDPNLASTDFKGLVIGTGTRAISLATTSTEIQGLLQGIPGMKVGGSRTITIPNGLAYGTVGATGVPSGAGLVYDIQVTAAQ